MKLGTIINAIPALQKLSQCNLTLRTAYNVKKLLRAAEDEIELFQGETQKIIASPELTEKEKIKRTDELLAFEIDTEINPVVISLSEDVIITPNDLSLLEDFIELID